MKKIGLIIGIFLCIGTFANAKHLYTEKQYQDAWCNKGEKEVVLRLDPKTTSFVRCDCISKKDTEQEFAIEIDFAKKWYEGLGQALFYSALTGKRAGVALIVENAEELKYIKRLKWVIKEKNLDVTVWKIVPAHVSLSFE